LKTLDVERYKKTRFYKGDKTMTLITDAKELLEKCKCSEDSIYDLVSFSYRPEDIASIQYLMEHVPKLTEECREMIHSITANEPSSKTYELRNNLRRMEMRLEAAIMYAKNYFKLN
jgi:hypothetical protein